MSTGWVLIFPLRPDAHRSASSHCRRCRCAARSSAKALCQARARRQALTSWPRLPPKQNPSFLSGYSRQPCCFAVQKIRAHPSLHTSEAVLRSNLPKEVPQFRGRSSAKGKQGFGKSSGKTDKGKRGQSLTTNPAPGMFYVNRIPSAPTHNYMLDYGSCLVKLCNVK